MNLKAFELCHVQGWNLSYDSLTLYEMREKLRLLKTSDPEFWAELCNNLNTSNMPKEGEMVVEDEEKY